jgi:hypothetical protein
MGLSNVLYGSGVIQQAMYDNYGPIDNSPFAEYFKNPRTIDSFDDAEEYVKGYIEACSSPLALEMDEVGCKKIGGHIHIAEITRSGFRWRIPPKFKQYALSRLSDFAT